MKFAHILALLCPLILGGCLTPTATQIVKPEIQAVYPPDALLTDCRNPYRASSTTGDVVDQLAVTRGALSECAVKVACVRQWRVLNDPDYAAPAERLHCANPETPKAVAIAQPPKPVAKSKPKPKQPTSAEPKKHGPGPVMTPIPLDNPKEG